MWFISSGIMSTRESGLIAVVLTILSILGSWLVTHSYSESQHENAIQEVQEFHRNNLQIYAKKAAEKVNNLSRELSRLAIYLTDELEGHNSENLNEIILSREERIVSAIHVIHTLKSVNDTALSDWEGVIDELLEEQKEEKEEKAEELLNLVARLEPLLEIDYKKFGISPETDSIKKEISKIRKDIHSLVNFIGITRSPSIFRNRKQRQLVKLGCLQCESVLTYKQRPNKNGSKAIECSECKSKFISNFTEDETFILTKREAIKEQTECPSCGKLNEISLDNLPHSDINVHCKQCSANLRISRLPNGEIKIKIIDAQQLLKPNPTKPMTEELLESVFNELPAQPWPSGVHKDVAAKLQINNTTSNKAINILIKQKRVNPQIDGVVYLPKSDEKGNTESN